MQLPIKQGIYKILYKGDWEIAEWNNNDFWQNDGDKELWLDFVTDIKETNGEFKINDCVPSEYLISKEKF